MSLINFTVMILGRFGRVFSSCYEGMSNLRCHTGRYPYRDIKNKSY